MGQANIITATGSRSRIIFATGLGWQPRHPEWGVAFWAETIDLSLVERYDAHAMIELGINSRPAEDQPIFDVDEVIRDMEPAFASFRRRSECGGAVGNDTGEPLRISGARRTTSV